MATKALHELGITDSGVKNRLAEMSGSLGGLFFEHEITLNEGAGVVAHRLAANIHDCKASDDDLWDEPKPGRGRTLNDAARMVARHLHDWCGDGPRRVFIGRGLGEQSQLAEVWRSGTGLSMKPVAKEPIREVVKDPFGGFRREVLEGYEAYSGGFHADMLVGGGR